MAQFLRYTFVKQRQYFAAVYYLQQQSVCKVIFFSSIRLNVDIVLMNKLSEERYLDVLLLLLLLLFYTNLVCISYCKFPILEKILV